jgi:hypothetical protein
MDKMKKIDIVDIPSTAKLCFVGHSKDIANYNEYNDLTFYFTTENIKENVFGKDWSNDYISFNVPHIYEENKDKFFVLHIENFLTEEIFGVETYSFQKDGWITLDYMRLKLTPKMINSGFGGWLLKKTKDNKCNDVIIDSNTNFKTFMRLFKGYDIKFYKY